MPIADNIGLKLEEIKEVTSLDGILKDVGLPECTCYAENLRKYICSTSNETYAKVARFLSVICGFSFTEDNNKDMYLKSGAYNMEELINDNDINIIKSLITKTNDPELLSRLYDICWLRKKDHEVISALIDNYFKTINNLISASWIYPIYRFKRLITVGRSTNHKERESEFFDFIIKKAKDRETQEPDFFTCSLAELLNKYKIKDDDLLKLCEQQAKKFLNQKRFHEASEYFDTLSKIYLSLKDYERSKELTEAYVETKVAEAKECIENENSFFKASHILAPAVERYKSVGNKERYNDLLQMLIDYQKRGMSEFETKEYKIDLSDIIENYNKAFENKNFQESVIIFTKLFNSPTKEHIENYFEQQKRNVFTNFAVKQKVDSEGKVVGIGAKSYEDGDAEKYKKQAAFEFIEYNWGTSCSTIIRVFLTHISLIPYEKSDIEELIIGNPLIEPGRESYFIDGLIEGLNYHFATSIHLLIPQIENMFRFILKHQGKIVIKLKDGIQDEMDINDMFSSTELRPVLEKVFGDTLILDLEAILVGRWGMNLRNRLAHGLITYEDAYSNASVYLTLLVLKILIYGWVNHASIEDK